MVAFPGRRVPEEEPSEEPEEAPPQEEGEEEEEEDLEPDREDGGPEEGEEDAPETEEPNDRVVPFPEEESVLSAFLKDLTQKADNYADDMFREAEEMDEDEVERLERLIPGTDEEQEEPPARPGLFRRPPKPEPMPRTWRPRSWPAGTGGG